MRRINIPYRFHSLPALLGLAACLGVCMPVLADELDPFQVETGHWMSFDRYNDNVKHHRPVGNEALGEKPKIEPPLLDAAQDGVAGGAALPTAAAKSTPVVAAPTRPIDLPVLPGVNKDFSIQVNSTLDNDATAPAQITESADGQSEMHLREQNWQDAIETAHARNAEQNAGTSDGARAPLDVRLSFLPNPKITPEPNPTRKPRPRLTEVPVAPKKAAPTPAAQKALAECSAIDAYKKRQLQAIQSDRKTLQALQSAISDLGLQKQLDFMAGAQQSSTLNVSSPNPAGETASPSVGTP